MNSNRKRMVGSAVVFLSLSAIIPGGTGAEDSPEVAYPAGYRHWTFLHSSMMSPANFTKLSKKPCEKPCISGLHLFYANDKAMEGLRTGSYPDGAIITDEVVEWLATSNGGAQEGQRLGINVMAKDSRRYSSTGGWGWGVFDNASKANLADAKTQEACYQCHSARKDHGFVYTEYRER